MTVPFNLEGNIFDTHLDSAIEEAIILAGPIQQPLGLAIAQRFSVVAAACLEQWTRGSHLNRFISQLHVDDWPRRLLVLVLQLTVDQGRRVLR